jgi:Large polyvalent protein associated domain 29
MSEKTYLSCAETAKLVRAALKKAFPGVKFSVRSSTYSGGASIRVGWVDGPSTKAVQAVTCAYAGGGFDGMIDMAYNKDAWLMPDGSAAFASSPGTTGSMGVYEPYSHAAPGPGARKVHFGADSVFTDREHSVEAYTAAVKTVAERWGVDVPEVKVSGGIHPYVDYVAVPNANGCDFGTLVHRELCADDANAR